jgi:ABC-type nickel/cobalt efflux system permease component RcnA
MDSGGGLFLALLGGAAFVGSLHSLAPDHWVPFAALARAQRWPVRRTALVTFLCGFGHVTVSALLGFFGLLFGREVFERIGQRMEAVAGLLLIGFGLAYGIWGLRRAAGSRLHGHPHACYDHVHDPSRATAWSLFLLFSADPCVAVIPLLFSAAPLGTGQTLAIVLFYEAATIGTMIPLVLSARAGAVRLRIPFLDRWGDAVAGGVIVLTGVVVGLLGI